MKRLALVAVLLLFLSSLLHAQNEAEIRIQKQTIEFLNNDSLHIELTLLLLIPREYLEFLPAGGKSIPYEIHMILKNQSGNIAGIKQIHRTLKTPLNDSRKMLVDTLQVSFRVKKGDYRISVLPLNFPIYVKAIKDFPLQTLKKEKLGLMKRKEFFKQNSDFFWNPISIRLTRCANKHDETASMVFVC